MKTLVCAALVALSLIANAKEPDWSAMVGSLVGSWKSYKSIPGEGFPEGMEVPDFVVEITINADGTATRESTVEGKVIEDKKVVYCIGTEFIVFCDDDARKGGIAPMGVLTGSLLGVGDGD